MSDAQPPELAGVSVKITGDPYPTFMWIGAPTATKDASTFTPCCTKKTKKAQPLSVAEPCTHPRVHVSLGPRDNGESASVCCECGASL